MEHEETAIAETVVLAICFVFTVGVFLVTLLTY
jgi:hypothetical protein